MYWTPQTQKFFKAVVHTKRGSLKTWLSIMSHAPWPRDSILSRSIRSELSCLKKKYTNKNVLIYKFQNLNWTTTLALIKTAKSLTLGKDSWLSSSCRFRMILKTKVLQANGSQRIIERSLKKKREIVFTYSCKQKTAVCYHGWIIKFYTQVLAHVPSWLHPGNLAAPWLVFHQQTSHECRHLSTK